ncbi:hypothetical protein K2E34_004090 [Escherichia coli]|nr:hypothetical protein [Escherichia coli]
MDNSSLLFWCLYITSFFGAFVITRWLCRKIICFFDKRHPVERAADALIQRAIVLYSGEFFCRITTRDGWHIMIIPPTHHARWDEAEKAFHVRKKVNTV